MYMKSDNGEIEVFLCPEESTVNDENSGDVSVTVNEPTPSYSAVDYYHQQTMSESVVEFNTELVAAAVATADPDEHIDMQHLEISNDFVVKQEPVNEDVVNEDVENVSKLTRIRKMLISEPDDFEPMGGGRFQLQTEDQNNIHNSGEKLYSLYNICVVWCQKEGKVAYCCLTDESWNSGPRKGIHC
jgi:transcription factor E2F2